MANDVENIDFNKINTEEVEKLLRTDLDIGLKEAEIADRRKEYGFNEVPEKKPNPILRFATKFWGLTPWMLEFTVILEWMLGKYLGRSGVFPWWK